MQMKKGDIVLIPFPFTDLTGIKTRPAVILIAEVADVTVSFITTQVKWQEQFDLLLEPTKKNGLKKTSLIRLSKLATIDTDLLIGRLGSIDTKQIEKLNLNLKSLLQLE
ncbi:MAG: hypothetical protein A2275_04460 [Bacteroidetes bacterium RIFOXYA12_FULL_35_11]|nr:MAG: hypothetical protein A2X01_07760 [Bacteroidetes bacterium GWF2_35_48]OFY75563.1 MAG: hypothetical protein A2275_04460 [Bacteroidetes bacterium RIFOXYA12_FULL_35_11]OFY99157.1 MAG: hypothetical protein A2491_12965 [Bacteroidetes bacterium RIFOXYC12_FULL_35_7]